MAEPKRLTAEQRAANALTAAVMERVGATSRYEVRCPRERSFMTPCVARDGASAVADGGVCVACGESPAQLLRALTDYTTTDIVLPPGSLAAGSTLSLEASGVFDPTAPDLSASFGSESDSDA